MTNYQGMKQLRLLITPSWLSGFICIVLSLLITVAAIIIASPKNSVIGQDLFAAHNASTGVNSVYQTVVTNLSRYPIIGDMVMAVFWGAIGLIVYIFTVNLIRALSAVATVEQEMHFVNAQRRSILSQAFLRLLTRLAALGAWLILIIFSYHTVLPYDLASAHSMTSNFGLSSSLSALTGTVLLVVDFSIQTICLRLLLLRERVFETAP
jgi:hypothetical protein